MAGRRVKTRQEQAPSLLSPNLADDEIRGDAKEIRPKPFPLPILRCIPIQPDKRVLRHLLGTVPGPYEVCQVIDQRILVAIDDLAKGLVVAISHPLHQSVICLHS